MENLLELLIKKLFHQKYLKILQKIYQMERLKIIIKKKNMKKSLAMLKMI